MMASTEEFVMESRGGTLGSDLRARLLVVSPP